MNDLWDDSQKHNYQKNLGLWSIPYVPRIHSEPAYTAIMKWDTIRGAIHMRNDKTSRNGERPEIETYNLPVSRSDLLLSPGGVSFGALFAKKPDGVSFPFLQQYICIACVI